MPRKIGGIVCDSCRKFVDYAYEDQIKECVIVCCRSREEKDVRAWISYGYLPSQVFTYCSQKCNENHFMQDRKTE